MRDPRLEQLERFNRWIGEECGPWDRFRISLVCSLLHATVVLLILSVLPPLQESDPIALMVSPESLAAATILRTAFVRG
jgi:hypothetical protein